MRREIVAEADIRAFSHQPKNGVAGTVCFKSKSVEDLMALTITKPSALIECILPHPGAVLIVGAKKSGKTIFAVQQAIVIASGEQHLWGQYRINQPGSPTFVLEQDDPGGEASLQQLVEQSPIPVKGKPFRWGCTKDLVLGPELLSTLEHEIRKYGYKYIALDSFSALRPRRKPNSDIVKDELEDFRSLDDLGKRMNCTIAILHHISHGNAAKAWSERAGGTFGVGMAVEGQIFIDKFQELGIDAPERLVRVELRHLGTSARVVRFREPTLDYEHVISGAAAEEYPMFYNLKNHFPGRPFTPQDIYKEMGISSATSSRVINRLLAAGVINKVSYGTYRLAGTV